jgi:hypothetical protein
MWPIENAETIPPGQEPQVAKPTSSGGGWGTWTSWAPYLTGFVSRMIAPTTATTAQQASFRNEQALARFEIQLATCPELQRTEGPSIDDPGGVSALESALDFLEEHLHLDGLNLGTPPIKPGKHGKLKALGQLLELGETKNRESLTRIFQSLSASPVELKDRVTALNKSEEGMRATQRTDPLYQPIGSGPEFVKILEALQSASNFTRLSKELFEALVERTSCCSAKEYHHIVRLQLGDLEQHKFMDHVHLNMFCARSDEPGQWHKLKGSVSQYVFSNNQH